MRIGNTEIGIDALAMIVLGIVLILGIGSFAARAMLGC